MANEKRNPLIIPRRDAPSTQKCLACGGTEFNRRCIQGIVISHCRKCGAEAQGGLPQLPQDPRIPYPPERYVPTVRFEPSLKKGEEPIEIRRRPDPTPEHRKGAPIPEPGEEQ